MMKNNVFGFVMVGMFFSLIYDLILSISEFLREKAWLVSKYEKVIYYLASDSIDEMNIDDLDNMNRAIYEYSKTIEKKLKCAQRKAKIKSFFKNKGE